MLGSGIFPVRVSDHLIAEYPRGRVERMIRNGPFPIWQQGFLRPKQNTYVENWYRRSYMRRFFIAAFLLVLILTFAGCSTQPKPYKEGRFLMDTYIEITAYGPKAQPAVKAAFSEFERIYTIANIYDSNSQLSQVNAAAGSKAVQVDTDILAMVERSRELADKMSGTFDITIGPLTELWGIGKKDNFVPSDTEIQQLLPLVNYRLVQVDWTAKTLFLPKAGMRLDMGGIAKGYATDRAVDSLKAQGVTSALINAGGNVRVVGTRPDGKPWRIGVQHPRNPDEVIAKLALTNWDTMETSGDYQRFILRNNVRYSHILDPRTGKQPSEVASVTMVMNNSADGDVFSTALFVLGVEQGMAVLKQFPGVDAIFVTVDGQVITTPGLAGKIEQ